MQLPNGSGWPWRWTKKEKQDWRVEKVQLMLALIKGVVNVGVVLSLKPILKHWQLCLSFKLDVHGHTQLKELDAR